MFCVWLQVDPGRGKLTGCAVNRHTGCAWLLRLFRGMLPSVSVSEREKRRGGPNVPLSVTAFARGRLHCRVRPKRSLVPQRRIPRSCCWCLCWLTGSPRGGMHGSLLKLPRKWGSWAAGHYPCHCTVQSHLQLHFGSGQFSQWIKGHRFTGCLHTILGFNTQSMLLVLHKRAHIHMLRLAHTHTHTHKHTHLNTHTQTQA